jgi:hypothetical protein
MATKLVITLDNGARHTLRLGAEIQADRALEYLAGAGARASFPALDRDWLETEDGRWIRRSAIVELALSNGQP